MVKQRMPQSVKDSRELNDNEKKFVEKVERDNLKALSLEELAQQFEDIGQQAQLMQGQILLEARSRFEGDREFGQWRASSLWACSSSQCTRLIQLARYFSDSKPLDKISITAAYEISAPINSDIADAIYNEIRGKNLPVAEVKRQIALKKGIMNTSVVPTSSETVITVTEQKQDVTPEKSKLDLIFQILDGLNVGEKLKLLRECLTIVNSSMRPK